MKSSRGTLLTWQYWLLTALGGVAFVVALMNIYLFQDSRSLREEISQRQQYINQTIQLSRLNNEIIKSLAQLAVANQDKQISDLLTSHGIVVTVNNARPADQKGGVSDDANSN